MQLLFKANLLKNIVEELQDGLRMKNAGVTYRKNLIMFGEADWTKKLRATAKHWSRMKRCCWLLLRSAQVSAVLYAQKFGLPNKDLLL